MFYHSRVRPTAKKEHKPGMVRHGSGWDAETSFSEALRDAVSSCRWMAVVWKVVDGRLHLVRCTTNDFPTGDFDAALEQLRVELDKFERLAADVPVPPLLPLADAGIDPAGDVG